MLSWSEKKQRQEKTKKSQLYKQMLDEQIQVKNRLLRKHQHIPQYYEPNTIMRLNTQPIPRQYDIDQYESQFIRAQQSSFLPIINIKRAYDSYDSTNYYSPYSPSPKLLNIRKPRSYAIPAISQEDDQRTEEYLQQCEDIINNLKMLTSKSANRRLTKDRPKYNNLKNSTIRDRSQNSLDYRKQRGDRKSTMDEMDKIYHSSQKEPQDLRLQIGKRNPGAIKSRNKTKDEKQRVSSKASANQSSPNTVNKQDSEALQAQKAKKQKRRHENIMKYLMQARTRGKKLSEKIIEYRSNRTKDKQQMKKVQQ